MEDKRVLFSALGLGFGVGLGMGLAATGRSRSFEKCSRDASSPHSRELIELELRKRVVDGKESNVTFDQFPYYLSEQTRVLLTNAGFLYLKKEPFIKHAKGLSPASRAILLSGPAEAYHQMLAKAVAHLFEAKLLLLDITTLNLKLQSRHGGPSDSTSKSLCETALERVTGLLGSFSSLPTRLPPKTSESGLWRQNSNVELQATIPKDCTLKRLKNSGSESDLSRLAATPSQGLG